MFEKCYFFKNFKMSLYGEGNKTSILAEDAKGQHLPLEYVMYKFIFALKKHFMDKKLKNRGSSFTEDDIRWVVTVPAIWSDSAKGLMRTAAVKSGMRDLVIALEPEAAAVHCLNLSTQEKDFLGGLGKVGGQFLVADLGGGTADITVVEVSDDGRLAALIPDTGGPWGAQNINDAFFQKCQDVFQNAVWSEVCKMQKSEQLEMENDFEKMKVQIGEGSYIKNQFIKLRIPQGLQDTLKGRGQKKPKLGKGAKGLINTERNQFEVLAEGVKGLFNETVELIIKGMKEIISKHNLEGIEQIVLVGGFAGSTVLKDRLDEVFGPEGKKIVVPTQPLYAVLKGAVIFGQNPDIYKSRVSKLTYGVNSLVPFDPKVHPAETKTLGEDGTYYSKDNFSIHVRKGETVSTEFSAKTITYKPLKADQIGMSIDIYTSDSMSPEFVTDAGCRLVSKWSIDMPDTTKGRDRQVEVKMIYGGTELIVKAFDKSARKEFQTKVEFQ